MVRTGPAGSPLTGEAVPVWSEGAAQEVEPELPVAQAVEWETARERPSPAVEPEMERPAAEALPLTVASKRVERSPV